MQMQHREHCNEVRVGREEGAVREIANERAPSALFHGRKLKGILEESRENRIDRRLEPEPKARTLALVAKRCFKDLELGLGRDVEPPQSPCSAEAGQQLFADVRPRAGSHFTATVSS
jgi:hypothetical protein